MSNENQQLKLLIRNQSVILERLVEKQSGSNVPYVSAEVMAEKWLCGISVRRAKQIAYLKGVKTKKIDLLGKKNVVFLVQDILTKILVDPDDHVTKDLTNVNPKF